jgi:hypothetical protein
VNAANTKSALQSQAGVIPIGRLAVSSRIVMRFTKATDKLQQVIKAKPGSRSRAPEAMFHRQRDASNPNNSRTG